MQLTQEQLTSRISEALLNDVSCGYSPSDGSLRFRLAGLERPNGLTIKVKVGLAIIYASVELDSLAGDLLSLIRGASQTTWKSFFKIRETVSTLGVTTLISINGDPITDHVEEEISSFSLEAKIFNQDENEDKGIIKIVSAIGALFLSLIPTTEEATTLELNGYGLDDFSVEGEKRQIVINRYERSRSNRAIAILVHGTKCGVCGFDFESFYGEIGQGFVEVHHTTPVHLMDSPKIVNPITDLIPLCANCHRMAHRKDPPYSPDQLISTISKSQQQLS